ncbi:MAG: DNA gyrase modulator, partial [Pseudomonadota bacterium]
MSGFLAAHHLDVEVLMKRGNALIDAALKAGADSADAVIVAGRTLAISVLNGHVEEHESAEGDDFGLRVFIGRKQAIVSGNTLDDRTASIVAERAVAMASAAIENPYAGLPNDDQLARLIPHLDLFDPTELSVETLRDLALEAEAAAMRVKGVTKSSGASANANHGSFLLLSSEGFAGAYATSLYNVSMTAIAGDGTQMERDYESSSKRHYHELKQSNHIGRIAGERAVRRLNPTKIKSGKQKVIFDYRVANSLVGLFAQAINGENIIRKNSFL